MRETRFRKFSVAIYNAILKTANLHFVAGKAILLKWTVHNFIPLKCSVSHRRMHNLGEDRINKQRTSVLQRGAELRRRYRTVRSGALTKFMILHSKIGRRVDFSSYKKP
jgi:hypothetical protein